MDEDARSTRRGDDDGQPGQLRRQEHARRGRPGLRDLPARRRDRGRARRRRRLPFSLKVLLENLLRTEDGADITADDIKALAGWDADAEPDKEIQFTPARVIMQDFTGVPVRRRPRHDARGDGTSSAATRRKINPLAPAEMVIDHSVIADVFGTPRPSSATSRSSTSATRSATSSCAGARAPSTTSRSSRRAPASSTRSTSSTSPAGVHVRCDDGVGLPRHLRRHRLPHHDGQRHRRGRLGRRRHRGRGRDARPAGLDAHPARRRLQALRRPARGLHRHRPRAHDHRDAAQARRRREVRGVLRPRRLRAAAGQPRHDRQHEPGVRLHHRGLPDRRADHRVPRAHRPPGRAARAGRDLRQGAGPLARPGRRAALLREARARPRHRRPAPRRPEAPAGPGLGRRQGRSASARRLRRR